MNYEDTMRYGAAQYADVIQELWQAGFKASFTQTGGMCAALVVHLDGGATLLITDADDTLSWERSDHRGWGVGLYPPDEDHSDGALAFEESEDGDTAALLPLIEHVLRSAASGRL
jgi:hypothetical protein